MKKFLSIILTIILILTMAGCAEKGESAEKGNATIKIGLLSIDDSLPFFMAKELGLYEKHGVNVELYQFGSAADKEAAFAAGELDGDMTDLIVSALIKKGDIGIKIVSNALGAVPEEGRFMMLAAPNSGIEKPEDLAGIEVAVGDNTIVHYLSDTILANAGVADSEIKSMNIPALSLRLEALLNGTVKAAVLPDPLASLALMQGAVCVFDDTKCEENLSQSIVLFSEKSLENKHEEIGRCMDAYFEAMEYINENPNAEDVRNAILEFTSIPEVLFDSYSTPKYSPRTLPSEEIINDTMAWMKAQGLLDSVYSYSDLVIDDFAK